MQNKYSEYLRLGILLILWIISSTVFSATYYSRNGYSTDYWDDTDSWSLVGINGPSAGSYPGINDDVVIAGYVTIYIDIATPQCNSLTLGGVSNGTLSYNHGTSGGVFTVSGDVTINSNGSFTTTGSGRTHSMYIGGNVYNAGNFLTYTGNNNYLNVIFNGTNQTISGNGTYYWYEMQVESGSTVTNASTSYIQIRTDFFIYGALDLASGSRINRYTGGGTFLVSGTLKLGGDTGGRTGSNYPSNFNTNTLTGSTVEYYLDGDQTVYSSPSYTDLILSGSGIKTSDGVTVDGLLSLEGTVSVGNVITYGSSSTLQYKGTTSRNTTSNELPSTFDGSGGIIIDQGSGRTVSLHANVTNNGNLQIISGELNIGSYTLDRSSNGGNFSILNDALLSIGGTNGLPSNYLTHLVELHSVITYDGTDQIISSLNSNQSYGKLSLEGSNIKTVEDSIKVDSLIIQSGTVLEIYYDKKVQTNFIQNVQGESGLILHSDYNQPNSSLIFNNSLSDSISATVYLATKANYADGFNNWQFVGIPITSIPKFYGPLSGSFMRQFFENTIIDEEILTPWKPLDPVIHPFQGYMITQDAPRLIQFQGTLNNQDKVFSLDYTSGATFAGLNLLANSYTTAIDIKEIDFDVDMVKEIYLFNTGYRNTTQDPESESGNNSGQYLVVPQATAGTLGLPGQISSMQGFFVQATSAGQSLSIPYSSTEFQTEIMRAPATPADDELSGTKFTLWSEHSLDFLWMFSSPNCSAAYDNGYDGAKFMSGSKSASMYVSSGINDFQVYATDNINNTLISFIAGSEDQSYTITVNHHNRESKYPYGLFLVDLLKDTVLDISFDSTVYEFEASPSSEVMSRFKILTEPPTVVQSLQNSPNLSVSSNGGKLYILGDISNDMQLYMYDLYGKLIMSRKLNSGDSTLYIKEAKTGIYLVRIKSNTTDFVRKVIL